MRGFVVAATIAMAAATPARAAYRGETYDCRFPKAGHVVIDTREPGATVTWRGKIYPVSGGSDHYVTADGDLLVLFGPNMKWWNFGDGDDRAVCPHVRNGTKAQ